MDGSKIVWKSLIYKQATWRVAGVRRSHAKDKSTSTTTYAEGGLPPVLLNSAKFCASAFPQKLETSSLLAVYQVSRKPVIRVCRNMESKLSGLQMSPS